MNAPKKNTAAKGLLGWWLSPPRSGVQRVIAPWEYRHLRAFAATRLAGAGAAGAAGIVCLPYEAYGWAAFFLIIAALNLAAGYWELAIARCRNRTKPQLQPPPAPMEPASLVMERTMLRGIKRRAESLAARPKEPAGSAHRTNR